MSKNVTSDFVEIVNDDDDIPAHTPAVPTMGDMVAARVSRRATLKGMSVAAAMASVGSAIGASVSREALAASASTLTFKELPHGYDEYMHVADGYNAGVLIRWGDAVTADAPDFDVNNQTADAQAKQFGYQQRLHRVLPAPAGIEELHPWVVGHQP